MEGNNKIKLKEAAIFCGCRPDYLAKLIRSGKLKGKKIGNAWFVNKDDLIIISSKKEDESAGLIDAKSDKKIDNFIVSNPLIKLNQWQMTVAAAVFLLVISFIFSILATFGGIINAKKSSERNNLHVPTQQELIIRHSIFGD